MIINIVDLSFIYFIPLSLVLYLWSGRRGRYQKWVSMANICSFSKGLRYWYVKWISQSARTVVTIFQRDKLVFDNGSWYLGWLWHAILQGETHQFTRHYHLSSPLIIYPCSTGGGTSRDKVCITLSPDTLEPKGHCYLLPKAHRCLTPLRIVVKARLAPVDLARERGILRWCRFLAQGRTVCTYRGLCAGRSPRP